ncbi:UNVERIFIED_CONTAM: WD repeat-containing protein 87 [Siphonaria sp. JEL0065]|nr:WD repeat-containing protein 87 [Siphonaria sp. JEL0065]
MFSFNLDTGAWSVIPQHNRSDDHTEEITSICNIELLGLFVTTSCDSTIRIWDVYNCLIREIQFHEPLECLCISNPRGDLLIGIQNRIDIIKFNLYLPPGYIKAVEAMTITDQLPEPPIQFDEKFDFLMNYMAQKRSHYSNGIDSFGSGSRILETFGKLNFMGAMQPVIKYKEQMMIKIEQEKIARLPKNTEDLIYLPIMEKLRVIMERRQKMIGMMRKQAEKEYREMEKKHNMLHQEFETFLKYKPYMGALFPVQEEIPDSTPVFDELPNYVFHEIEDYIPPDPLALVAAEEEVPEIKKPEVVKGVDEFRVIEATDDPILPFVDPKSPDPVEEPVAVPEEIAIIDPVITDAEPAVAEVASQPQVAAVEEQKKGIILPPPKPKDDSPKLYIAPDGEIPNSVMGKTVKNWKALHAWNNMVTVSLFKKGRTKGDIIGESKEKQANSETYKAKLKKMMDEKAKREEEERRKREEEAGNIMPEEEVVIEEKPPLNDEDDDDDPYSPKSKGRNFLKSLKPMEILRYPKLIDRAVGYSWFPVDEILHEKTADDSETGLRRLKVENNADVLFPMVMDCFKTLTMSKERKEAIQYATWILEEYGIRDTTVMARTYMRYLQNAIFMKIDNEHEIETLAPSATSMHRGSLARASISPGSGSLLAKPDANALSPGSKSISSTVLPAATQDLFQNVNGTECRNLIMSFLKKTLKTYLMTATTDFELSSKLKNLNENGYEDRSPKKKDDDVDDSLDPTKLAPTSRRKGFIQPMTSADNGPEKKKSGPLIYTSTPVLSELLTIEQVEPLLRDPIAILQNPNLKDFVTSMLFYARYNERRMVKEATDKSFKLEQELRALEEARLKREHDAKLAEFLKSKEAERLRKLEERKAKMLALRNRGRGGGDLPTIKKGGIRDHLFTGCTHQSKCHPSRETLDGPLPKFPPLPTGFTTSMALHLATMNKSMPVENVELNPFETPTTQQSSRSAPVSRPQSQLNRIRPISSIEPLFNRGYENALETDEAAQEYLHTAHLWEGDPQTQDSFRQVEMELAYIRGGGELDVSASVARIPSAGMTNNRIAQSAWSPVSGNKRSAGGTVKTNRKYFILDLEEDIEKHKISGKKSKITEPKKSKWKKEKKKQKKELEIATFPSPTLNQ